MLGVFKRKNTVCTCVRCLSQLVHEANTEKLQVKDALRLREDRIAELETAVESLNKVIINQIV